MVIVGASLAGLNAAQALREAGYSGSITLVGDEPHAPYDRPPLSKQFLIPGTERESLALADTALLGLTEEYGRRAVHLDVRNRAVHLDSGRVLEFDQLVIATGVGARQWPEPVPRQGVHTLRTLDDAYGIKQDLNSGVRRVLVVGDGFIGSEATSTARSLGHEVTLAGKGRAPLNRAIGDDAAGFVSRLHREAGVTVLPGVRVTALHGSQRVTGATVNDDRLVPADVVLLALGDQPHTAWLADSGLKIDRGLVTDVHARTLDTNGEPLPHIVAAGDVTRFPHPHASGLVTLGHWSNAVEQARVAAATLLRPDAPPVYRPVASFWTTQYGVKFRAVGLPDQADRTEVHEFDLARRRLDVAYYRNDQLIGALTANRAARIVAYRSQLAEALSLLGIQPARMSIASVR
nr:FAD/NAD(P)-binding oxidoreductase [Actinoplanes solisilvae]